jgi:hypothetical protein
MLASGLGLLFMNDDGEVLSHAQRKKRRRRADDWVGEHSHSTQSLMGAHWISFLTFLMCGTLNDGQFDPEGCYGN